jgi:hypothetical protein
MDVAPSAQPVAPADIPAPNSAVFTMDSIPTQPDSFAASAPVTPLFTQSAPQAQTPAEPTPPAPDLSSIYPAVGMGSSMAGTVAPPQNNFGSPTGIYGSPNGNLANAANAQPVAVIKTLSTRGLEYLFMSICLWIGAVGLTWGILSLVNGSADAKVLAFPATSLVVTGPIFAWFFIRLKRAELANPQLRFDPSKRRTSQITQILAFLTALINVITFVYLIIAASFGSEIISVGKSILNLLVILAVSGGILAYYWVDEHRSFNG